MRGVDLVRTSFDFDLTFAALLMHPDGKVYHRYGARDERGADTWLGMASWESLLRSTLEEHEAYANSPGLPGVATSEDRKPLVLEEVPAFAKRDKGACIHCHSVFPALYEQALATDSWSNDQRWVYPAPGRVGMDLDTNDQTLVSAVAPASVAARSGFRVGDRLIRAGDQDLATVSDLSQVLHDLSAQAGAVEVEIERGAVKRKLALELPRGWKRAPPLEYSWRAFKWGFKPAPGFGGPALDAGEKRILGLPEEQFAFRLTYFVTWGENRRYGLQARGAGLREKDIFLSADGMGDFASVDHFHAWWRLTREIGKSVEVEILRRGVRQSLKLEVLP